MNARFALLSAAASRLGAPGCLGDAMTRTMRHAYDVPAAAIDWMPTRHPSYPRPTQDWLEHSCFAMGYSAAPALSCPIHGRLRIAPERSVPFESPPLPSTKK